MKQIQKLIEASSLLRLELEYYGIDADGLLKELKEVVEYQEHTGDTHPNKTKIMEDAYINAEYLVLDHIRQWDGKEDNSALKSALKAKFAELESSKWISVDERMPENTDRVVVVELDCDKPYMQYVHIGWYDVKLGLWCTFPNGCMPDYWMPDYWMPIPPIKEEHEF